MRTDRPNFTLPASTASAAGVDAQSRSDHLVLTDLVLPEQSNHYGTLFAPNGLALLGKAAYLAATRFTRQAVVMAGANRIKFQQPAPVGALLRIDARIDRVGHTSLTVRVVASFDAAPGTHADAVLSGDFEMVAVDEHGRPTPVSVPATPAASAQLAMTAAADCG